MKCTCIACYLCSLLCDRLPSLSADHDHRHLVVSSFALDHQMDDIPPSYSAMQQTSKQRAALDTLPDNALLRVLSYCTFVDLWSLRMTCKKLNAAAMAILRSAFLPQYSEHVSYPYTSDALAPRERQTFDLFIALLVTNNRLATESELHLLPLQSGSIPKELFALYQPRSRLEDLCGRELARLLAVHR